MHGLFLDRSRVGLAEAAPPDPRAAVYALLLFAGFWFLTKRRRR